MNEKIDLKLYSVADLKNYFFHNKPVKLLSDEIISRTRAWSIIHNPYATDDLYVVSALFVNDEIAAYTHLFPDEQDGQRIYWNTTLYCAPKYEGRGYAAIVIGQFCEIYGEYYFDLNAAAASVVNLKFCGLIVDYVPQYVLSEKAIRGNSLKAKIARLQERFTYACTSRKRALLNEIHDTDYSLRYTKFVDDHLYDFIRAHSANNLFLRTREMFNWILQYPLILDCPIIERVEQDSQFSSNKQGARISGVEVYNNRSLIGFYILNTSSSKVDVTYLYYEPKYEREVFLSISEHVLQFDAPQVVMTDERLCAFLQQYKLYTKSIELMKSFSHPQGFNYDKSKTLQSGDGDNLT